MLIFLWLWSACGTAPEGALEAERAATAPSTPLPPERLRRLTHVQYRNAVRDLFGSGVGEVSSLEADERIEGLFAVGSAHTTISSYGVEKYEAAAYAVAAQALADPVARSRWLTCTPQGTRDDGCAATVLEELGRVAWRRPLSAEELDTLTRLAAEGAVALGDFDAGLEFAVAALLMSPSFLYRVERVGADARYEDWSLASRLSFFLWNSIPDAALLSAAEAGELQSEAGLAAQVDRMLLDPRAVEGVRSFFGELLWLDALDSLSKDPVVFPYMSDSLGPSAREEALLGVEHLVFVEEGSYLTLFTTQRAFVDRTLAALYNVPAPVMEGFGEVRLSAEGGRRGLLGSAAFLVPNAHAVSTSATRRGIFVREVLLCQPIPDPPADANTAIPEVSADAPTMRERIAVHLEDPFCASCHQLTDPIGLALETFDGLGRQRLTENGAPIDPSGVLDGASFADAWGLGAAVAAHPQTGPCLTQKMLQYATGALAEELDPALLSWHAEGFGAAGHQVLWLMRDVALSPAFRQSGTEVGEAEGEGAR